jgi:hypothetical protein
LAWKSRGATRGGDVNPVPVLVDEVAMSFPFSGRTGPSRSVTAWGGRACVVGGRGATGRLGYQVACGSPGVDHSSVSCSGLGGGEVVLGRRHGGRGRWGGRGRCCVPGSRHPRRGRDLLRGGVARPCSSVGGRGGKGARWCRDPCWWPSRRDRMRDGRGHGEAGTGQELRTEGQAQGGLELTHVLRVPLPFEMCAPCLLRAE